MGLLDRQDSNDTTNHSTISVENNNNQERWRLREAVGRYGTFVIVFGAITIPILLALLIVLWGDQNGIDGANASKLWRYIVLNGWLPPSVAALAFGIGACVGLQALICTSLAASTLLETKGARLSHIAELSMMRGVNDGPWRFLYLTWSESWKNLGSLQPILVIMLYLGAVATKLGSTILLTDLESRAILGDFNQTTVNVSVASGALGKRQYPMGWYTPPEYNTFAELPSGINPAPSADGFSDTGNIKRFYLPLSAENRTRTRQFSGRTYGWNTRVACAPPSFDAFLQAYDPGYASVPFQMIMSGNISHENTLSSAGVSVPPVCTDGKCLPSNFNCNIVTALTSGKQQGKEGLGLCSITRNNTIDANARWLNDGRTQPVNANSMVFFVTTTNGDYDDWSYTYDRIPLSASEGVKKGEWKEWTLGKGFKFGVTMCYVSTLWELSHVEVSSTRDPVAARPDVLFGGLEYDTARLRRQFGAVNDVESDTERGILSVNSVSNTTIGTNSTLALDIGFFWSFGGNLPQYNIQSYTMHAGTTSSGSTNVNPFMDYSGLFQDVVVGTGGRAALALQSMMSLKAANHYYALLPFMEDPEPASLRESVMAQVPARWTGLLIYIGIIVLNFTAVIGITASFLLQTRYSKQGHFWHTISQIITNETVALIQNSNESRDDHVMKDHLVDDPVVVVTRCKYTGRVQVIREDKVNGKMVDAF